MILAPCLLSETKNTIEDLFERKMPIINILPRLMSSDTIAY